jgi:oligoendopeptidase F
MADQQDIDAIGVNWDLNEYFEDIDTPKYNDALTELQKLSEDFAGKWRSHFDDLENFSLSASELINLLEEVEDIEAKAYRIQAFAYCKSTAHTEDMKYQGELAKLSEIWSRCWNRMMFYELGLKKLPDAKIKEYMGSEEFSNYFYYLDQSTKNKKFALDSVFLFTATRNFLKRKLELYGKIQDVK